MLPKIKEDFNHFSDKGIRSYFLRKFIDRGLRLWWNSKPKMAARGNYKKFRSVKIVKPIFLLGTQGGGLTFVSRLLRRHRDVVSISGNHKYWAGMDEIQNEYFFDLPESFRLGIKERHGAGIDEHTLWGKERSWVYGCDDLVDQYLATGNDLSREDEEQFTDLIKCLIHTYSTSAEPRFIDKSQSFILKLPLLKKIFPDAKFVVVSRDPTIMCWRAASNIYPQFQKRDLSLNERFEFACQHWNHSYQPVIDDGGVHFVKFEDLLRSPERSLAKILEYCELKGEAGPLLPQSNDEFPLGSVGRDKWFPIKPEINQKYIDLIDKEHSQFIWQKVQNVATQLGYDAL